MAVIPALNTYFIPCHTNLNVFLMHPCLYTSLITSLGSHYSRRCVITYSVTNSQGIQVVLGEAVRRDPVRPLFIGRPRAGRYCAAPCTCYSASRSAAPEINTEEAGGPQINIGVAQVEAVALANPNKNFITRIATPRILRADGKK